MRGNHLLVAAGGTGGHLYPALAVAERFRELVEKPQVTFVGTERGLESRIVPKAGFPLEFVRAAPLRGGSVLGKLKALLWLVSGMRDSWKLLKRLKPSVVMGVSAYVSGTVLLAAALRGTPTLILEPNAEPGLATISTLTFAATSMAARASPTCNPAASRRTEARTIRAGSKRATTRSDVPFAYTLENSQNLRLR